MAIAEIYDMERVEVLKGPQGTLFGRGSQAGAIHYITRKPAEHFGGYLTTGMGDFGMMHFEGAVNVPITQDFSTREAGIYSYREGYVKNLSGGDALNGKNTFGGRFSVTYAPQNSNFRADMMINYQKDDNPGTGFINPNGVRNRDMPPARPCGKYQNLFSSLFIHFPFLCFSSKAPCYILSPPPRLLSLNNTPKPPFLSTLFHPAPNSIFS